MPVEIRELVVKITVEETETKPGIREEDLFELKNKIVKECLDKIMVKLENQTQR